MINGLNKTSGQFQKPFVLSLMVSLGDSGCCRAVFEALSELKFELNLNVIREYHFWFAGRGTRCQDELAGCRNFSVLAAARYICAGC